VGGYHCGLREQGFRFLAWPLEGPRGVARVGAEEFKSAGIFSQEGTARAQGGVVRTAGT